MTDLAKRFFSSLPRNILHSFRGRNLMLQMLAIGATVVIVTTDFDWTYFKATRPLAGYLLSAVFLGWVIALAFPAATFIVGSLRNDRRAVCTAFAAAQAAVIGVIISSFYKAFTGRPSPRHSPDLLIDTSRVFHFGFLRGGVFFGWPSSHTAVAFAIAAAVWRLFPRSRVMRSLALIYAFYVGLGVSMTIHWFSDFVAGAIIGTAIGMTVGRDFRQGPGCDAGR